MTDFCKLNIGFVSNNTVEIAKATWLSVFLNIASFSEFLIIHISDKQKFLYGLTF